MSSSNSSSNQHSQRPPSGSLEMGAIEDATQSSSSSPPRPQLHIDTHTLSQPQTGTPSPPRSRDGRQYSFTDSNNPIPSKTPSLRSQRSDLPRVRFSTEVQTLGEQPRAIVSPSITNEEALSRLQHQTSQNSLNRRQASIQSDSLPYLPSPTQQDQPIRGILRSPTSPLQPTGRPTRPRGWSLRRQLFSKQDANEISPSTAEIGLSTFPSPPLPPSKHPQTEPRSIEDVDAIRAVTAALEEAQIHPPIADIKAKQHSSTQKHPVRIEPEETQALFPFYSTWARSHRTRYIIVEQFKNLGRRIKRMRDSRLMNSKGRGREIPVDIPERGKVLLIDERTGREYRDNVITSSRYTPYSFLPRQIWAQFSKIANLYTSLHPLPFLMNYG